MLLVGCSTAKEKEKEPTVTTPGEPKENDTTSGEPGSNEEDEKEEVDQIDFSKLDLTKEEDVKKYMEWVNQSTARSPIIYLVPKVDQLKSSTA